MLNGAESQAMFEAMFPDGYTPKIDTRTPEQVKAGYRIGES